MATLFLSFFSALGGGGGAAAGAAGAASSGLSVGGFLSGLSTVVGGLASIAAGAQQKAAMDQQAMDEETRAVQETINGRTQALEAMKKLNDDMAAITVAGYASGLQSSGSIEQAQTEAQRIGETNMNMARDNSKFQAAARRSQAKQNRIEGRGAMTGGIFGAIKGGLSLFSRDMARGG